MKSFKLLKALNDVDDKYFKQKENQKKNISFNSFLITLISIIVLTGGVYAGYKIIELNSKVTLTPTFTSQITPVDTNKVWCGTFNLVWNDFQNEYMKRPIEFEEGYSLLADELNKQVFTVNELSEDSYYKIYGNLSISLKNKIENGIKEKFGEESQILDQLDWNRPNDLILYAMLKKEFHYLYPFKSEVEDIKFFYGDSQSKYIKAFGIEYDDLDILENKDDYNNVEVLFYNSKDDFAIRLKTKEKEDVLLYKTNGKGKSFEELYKELNEKKNQFTGNSSFVSGDILSIPYISINEEINYDELCFKIIKGTQGEYIQKALQSINFELNNTGGSVKSETAMSVTQKGIKDMMRDEDDRDFIFNSSFVLFVKEEDKSKPYFSLYIDDTELLNLSDRIVKNDLSVIKNEDNELKTIYNSNYSNQEVKTLAVDSYIKLDDIVYSLEEALNSGKVTSWQIASECLKDYENKYKIKDYKIVINENAMSEDGTRHIDDFYQEFYYEDYTILYIVKGTRHQLIVGPEGELYDLYIQMNNLE